MCDVTDVRSKVPTDWSKFSTPQDVHFLAHFCFDRNEITLSICGDISFLPSFLLPNVIFKAISHISGSKKWSKGRGTDRQTHIKILRPPAQKPFGQKYNFTKHNTATLVPLQHNLPNTMKGCFAVVCISFSFR